MTPFLIFMGIPPVYAVPNEVNNILATSVSGSLTHWYKQTLDYKMGLMIVSGGVAGTILGIMTFTFFSEIGKISLIISLLYMYLLAIVGTLMLIDGYRERNRLKKKIVTKQKLHEHNWFQGLPFRIVSINQIVRKRNYTNIVRFGCRFCCSNDGYWWSILDGACNDLYCGDAS